MDTKADIIYFVNDLSKFLNQMIIKKFMQSKIWTIKFPQMPTVEIEKRNTTKLHIKAIQK